MCKKLYRACNVHPPPFGRGLLADKVKRRIKRNRNKFFGILQNSKRRALSEEDVLRIRTNLNNSYLRNLFYIGLNTGSRLHEYLNMKLSTIHLEESLPHLQLKGKGGKTRIIVLTEGMIALFKKQLILREIDNITHDSLFYCQTTSDKPSLRTIEKYFSQIREITGVYFTSHQLRYTMATFKLDRGVPHFIVKQRLGHLSSVTDIYTRAKLEKQYRILNERVGVL